MTEIAAVYSLKELHQYLENHPNKKDVMVFFDFDLTLIDDDKDVLLEPQVTKDLFKFLRDNGIDHCVVTARFYDTVCSDKTRELPAMDFNIKHYIHPILEQLGLDVNPYKGKDLKNVVHKIHNDKGECVGVLYRGIFFGDRKGEIIKHYLEEAPFKKSHTIFIDDYDYYLDNVRTHMPSTLTIKRHYEHHLK